MQEVKVQEQAGNGKKRKEKEKLRETVEMETNKQTAHKHTTEKLQDEVKQYDAAETTQEAYVEEEKQYPEQKAGDNCEAAQLEGEERALAEPEQAARCVACLSGCLNTLLPRVGKPGCNFHAGF